MYKYLSIKILCILLSYKIHKRRTHIYLFCIISLGNKNNQLETLHIY